MSRVVQERVTATTWLGAIVCHGIALQTLGGEAENALEVLQSCERRADSGTEQQRRGSGP